MKLEDTFKKVKIDRETTLNNYSALQCVEISNAETIRFFNWAFTQNLTVVGDGEFLDEENQMVYTEELLKIYQDETASAVEKLT